MSENNMTERETPTFKSLDDLYGEIYPYAPKPGHHGAQSENISRMKRALSWLARYEACEDNYPEEQFLFLWISFNAAYSDDASLKQNVRSDEPKKIKYFLDRMVAEDANHISAIITDYDDAFRTVVDDRFLFSPFWKAEYDRDMLKTWKGCFDDEKRKVHYALQDRQLTKPQMKTVLRTAFERLYILRNQIMHGCASWSSEYNTESVKAANAILAVFVPEFLQIMLLTMRRKKSVNWGLVAYPPYLSAPNITDAQPPQRKTYGVQYVRSIRNIVDKS